MVRRHSHWRRGGCWSRRLCSRWRGESAHFGGELRTHSRAQRYGSNARILGRAQVARLNADLLEVMIEVWDIQREGRMWV